MRLITMALSLLSVVLVSVSSGAGRDWVAASYCGRTILRDYEAPLRDLPPIDEFDLRKTLPFAPPGVRMGLWSYPLNEGRLMAGAGSFGYQLSGPFDGVTVDWNVSSSLMRLSAKGNVQETVAAASDTIDNLSSHSVSTLVLTAPSRPGSYRYDIDFETMEGDHLARYGRYIQVLPQRISVRLDIKRTSLRAGGVLETRVENIGTHLVEFAQRAYLQRRVGSLWQNISDGRIRPGFAQRYRLGAGRSGGCLRIPLSRDLLPGRYRVLRSISRSSLDPGAASPGFRRTAQFRIQP